MDLYQLLKNSGGSALWLNLVPLVELLVMVIDVSFSVFTHILPKSRVSITLTLNEYLSIEPLIGILVTFVQPLELTINNVSSIIPFAFGLILIVI